jgi:hypothetical protein
MNVNLIIADNFYDDPYSIRNYALSQEFNVKGNYPGVRTSPCLTDTIKNAVNDLVAYPAGGVTDWLNNSNSVGYTGSFQLCTSKDKTWIHSDHNNMWAGVCYLTPDAPINAGTAIYRYKETGEMQYSGIDYGFDGYDTTKWELVDKISNIFNRLILYRANLFHSAINYFGDTPNDGRLFQTFFFNTRY